MGYPENPILVRVRRGGAVESVHRGAWVLVDGEGAVLGGAGAFDHPYFARSSVKSLQALPLFESGAAQRYELTDSEVALAVSSHSGEACHTEVVAALLSRLSLSARDLRCGPQAPTDPAARLELSRRGDPPSALHNNCSGKHAGFLALARHLGEEPATYLDPAGEVQTLVRRAIAEMTGVDEARLEPAVDGCSAPTYRVPLAGIATGFARVTNPGRLPEARAAACRRITDAAAERPVLVAGSSRRLCTDLLKATGGRLFGKVGAEAVYAIGVVGGDRALAVKVDDGQPRGMHALVLGLLEHFGLLEPGELEALSPWRERRLFNWAGLEVGRVDLLLDDEGNAGGTGSVR